MTLLKGKAGGILKFSLAGQWRAVGCLPSAGDTLGRRKGVPALGSGDTGNRLCCVCAEPLHPPVQPFGQVLVTFRQLEMVHIGVCNLAPFFTTALSCASELEADTRQIQAL